MWVKICGVRDVATAMLVAEAGGDAVGLNFYPKSARYVAPEHARDIVSRLPKFVEPVGLFVNASVDDIRKTAHNCGLRTLQLHGDEPPELMAELREFRLLRAFRVGSEGLAELDAYLDRLTELQVPLWGCLVDAKVDGVYGGTGERAPWELLASEWTLRSRPPLILAGGLTAANVAAAVGMCAPWGVDVAGGVEAAPAVKDPRLVRLFCENARSVS